MDTRATVSVRVEPPPRENGPPEIARHENAPREPRALVEIERLSKGYVRGEQLVPVLTDINLTINEGDFVAMMGPSGSGKTTLLNLIAGIDSPTPDELLIGGVDIAQCQRQRARGLARAHVGYIFQLYNLMPVLTAYENVELPLLLTPLSRAERRERVERARDGRA